jgi:hypothetical protein
VRSEKGTGLGVVVKRSQGGNGFKRTGVLGDPEIDHTLAGNYVGAFRVRGQAMVLLSQFLKGAPAAGFSLLLLQK